MMNFIIIMMVMIMVMNKKILLMNSLKIWIMDTIKLIKTNKRLKKLSKKFQNVLTNNFKQ